MARNRTFAREEKYPSYFVNAQQDFISTFSQGLLITKLTTTSIRVPAGAGNDRVALGVNGLFRWIEANVDRSVPGGSPSGTYDIYAVASNNAVTNVPVSDTDATNYAFDLRIVNGGATPAGVDQYRKIGSLTYDGTAGITAIYQTADKTSDKFAAGAPADFPAGGNLSAQEGFAARVRVGAVGPSLEAGVRLGIANDTYLYRASAGVLRTPNAVGVGSLNSDGAAFVGATDSSARLYFGVGGDSSLYRAGVNALVTPGQFTAAGEITSGSGFTISGPTNGFSKMSNTVTSTLLRGAFGGDAQPRFLIQTDGSHAWGPGGATAADISLSRLDANTLYLTAGLRATKGAVVNDSSATQVALGAVGGNAGIAFGVSQDATIFRSAVGVLTASGLVVSGAFSGNGDVVLGGAVSKVGFFATPGVSQRSGYGIASAVGAKPSGGLTAASTFNDVLAVISSMAVDLRAYNLIGA